MIVRQAPRIDTRAVLFGPPLFQFVADEVTAASTGSSCRDSDLQLELTREMHARWMMTPREDLGGKTPRETLVADLNRIQSDLEHRSEQWSRQKSAPPGLATTSAAYLRGGFGTTEVVLYFDLVRALFDKAWKLADQRKCHDRENLVERLMNHSEAWLHQPYDGGETPAELIDRERQRLPIVSTGAHFDCDCPICRAEADGLFGDSPMFMWFDGHHLELEDHFAFSLCKTEEEWQEQQNLDREVNGEMESHLTGSKDEDHDTAR